MKTLFLSSHPVYRKKLLLAALLVCSTCAFEANAATTSVNCPPVGTDDLQTKINAASSGDTLIINGTCTQPASGSITFNSGTTLTLTGANASAAIQGSNPSSMINILNNNTININNLSLIASSNPQAGVAVGGTSSITNCVVQGFNQGMVVIGSTPLISGNLFTGNVNAITLQNGQIGSLSNNTLTANTAGSVAAINFSGGTVNNFLGNTITQNQSGVGLNNGVVINNMSQNIIVGNTPGADLLVFSSLPNNHSYNLIGLQSGWTIGTGDQVNVTPAQINVQPLANNGGPTQTMALGGGSIAIYNASSNPPDGVPFNTTANGVNLCPSPQTSPVTTDQRGAPRPGVGKTGCDIGAYETGQAQLGVTTIAGAAVTPPYAINFPSVAQGSSDAPVTVQYSNTGNSGPISVADTLTGLTSPADFSLSAVAGPASLMPTDIDSVNVTYTATAGGTQNATLNLTPTAGAGVTLASTSAIPISLTGTGIASNPTPSAEFSNIIAALKSKTLVAKSNKLVDQLEFAGFVGGVALADFEFQHNQLSGPLGACAILKGLATATDGTAKDTLVAGSPANMSASIVATAHSEIGIIITDLSCH